MSTVGGPRDSDAELKKSLADLQAQAEGLNDEEGLNGFVGLAHALKDAGHLREALAVAQQGLATFRGAPEQSIAEAYNILGQVLHTLGALDDAAAAHRQMAEIGSRISSGHIQGAAQFALGSICQTRGDSKGARAHYADAFRRLRGTNEARLPAQILLNLADLRMEAGELKQAHELLESAAELINALGDGHLEASLKLATGNCLVKDQDYLGAAGAYREALTKARKLGELPLVLVALQNIGAVHLDLDLPKQAQRWYEKGVKVSATFAASRQRLALLRGAAGAALKANDEKRAAAHLRNAAELAGSSGSKDVWALTVVELSRLETRAGEVKKAKELLDEVRAFTAKSTDQVLRDCFWQARLALAAADPKPLVPIVEVVRAALKAEASPPLLLRSAAEHLTLVGEFDKASELAAEGLAVDALRGRDRAWQEAQIGAMLLSSGGARQACSFFSAAARAYARFGDKQLLFQCNNDLANSLADIGDYAKATKKYAKCLRLGEALGDRAMVAQALSNWAETLRRQRRPKEALAFLRRAQRLYRLLGDTTERASTQAMLGLVLSDLRRPKEAREAFRLCLKLVPRGADGTKAVAIGGLAALESDVGHFRNAAKLYARAIHIEEAARDWQHEIESRAGALIAFAGTADRKNLGLTTRRLFVLLAKTSRGDLVSWAIREASETALEQGHRGIGLELLGVWVAAGFAIEGAIPEVTKVVGRRIADVAIRLVALDGGRFRTSLRAVSRHVQRQVGEPLGQPIRTAFAAAEQAAMNALRKRGEHPQRPRRRPRKT